MTFEDVRTFLDTSFTIAPCFDCHEEGGDLPQVFRNDETLYDTLMTRTVEKCENRALVVPGDPENSALYLVLKGTCGTVSQMPYGCYVSPDGFENTCAPDAEIERLRLWIAGGAMK